MQPAFKVGSSYTWAPRVPEAMSQSFTVQAVVYAIFACILHKIIDEERVYCVYTETFNTLSFRFQTNSSHSGLINKILLPIGAFLLIWSNCLEMY